MSKYHSNSENLNKIIFPKSIINNNNRYPKISIQYYSSCCLWFYGEILCLFFNKKYNSFKSIFDSMKFDNVEFYIDVINLISEKFYDIKDLFKVEKDEISFIQKFDLNRFFLSGKINYTVKIIKIISTIISIKPYSFI